MFTFISRNEFLSPQKSKWSEGMNDATIVWYHGLTTRGISTFHYLIICSTNVLQSIRFGRLFVNTSKELLIYVLGKNEKFGNSTITTLVAVM